MPGTERFVDEQALRTATTTSGPLGFVKPLDGVRAFAVLAVMGTHTDLMGFSGGGAGVDIFFVLSGFLITTLLLEERDTFGRIFLGRFYGRRALRLFPALFAMLAFVGIYAATFADSEQAHALLREIIAAGTYTYNFAWIHGVEDVYLGHTWSLALEEQFYLVWPLVLMGCLRLRGERLLLVVTAVIIVVIVTTRTTGGYSLYGLTGLRPDAILIGCVAAMLRRRSTVFGTAARTPALTIASTGILILAVSTRGWLGQTDRLGTVCVAIAAATLTLSLVASPNSRYAHFLSIRPLTEIGKRSYGLYIWHLPIFRWVAEQDFVIPDPVSVALKYGATFAVAWLSYRYVEAPALRLKKRFRPPTRDEVPAPA